MTRSLARSPIAGSLLALLVVVAGLVLAGCGGRTSKAEKAPKLDLAATASDSLQAANQDVAFRFLKSVDAKHEGNVVVSPLSLSMVLQMLANGADPGTDRKLLASLGFSPKIGVPEANAFNASLIASLRKAQGAEFQIANAIWTASGYVPTDDLVEVVKRDFDGTSSMLPDDDVEAAYTINGWVDGHTAHRITKIISPEEIQPADGSVRVMFLANALAFTGTWRDRFEESSTGPQKFHAPDKDVTVDMMHRTTDDQQTDYLAVPGKAGFQAVRLPYGKNGTWVAYVLVPNNVHGLDDVIATLTPNAWNNWASRFQPNTVMLSMPKLDLRYQRDLLGDFDLLGVPRRTYNSLVTKSVNPVILDFARQQAMLQVDEAGTKAAAATVVGASEGAAMMVVSVDVTADHPYLFVLAEQETGAIAMTAAIRNPLEREVGL